MEQKEKRLALPNAEIMIHQPSGGAQGQATEIEIAAEHILRTKKKLNTILSENTGQPYETIVKDTERDNWLTARGSTGIRPDRIKVSRKIDSDRIGGVIWWQVIMTKKKY